MPTYSIDMLGSMFRGTKHWALFTKFARDLANMCWVAFDWVDHLGRSCFNHFELTKNMSWKKTCIFWAKWMKCIYDFIHFDVWLAESLPGMLRFLRLLGCNCTFGDVMRCAIVHTNIFWWRGWNLLFFSQPAIALYVFSAPPSACCCRETPQTCTYALCPHGWVDTFHFLFCCFL